MFIDIEKNVAYKKEKKPKITLRAKQIKKIDFNVLFNKCTDEETIFLYSVIKYTYYKKMIDKLNRSIKKSEAKGEFIPTRKNEAKLFEWNTYLENALFLIDTDYSEKKNEFFKQVDKLGKTYDTPVLKKLLEVFDNKVE